MAKLQLDQQIRDSIKTTRLSFRNKPKRVSITIIGLVTDSGLVLYSLADSLCPGIKVSYKLKLTIGGPWLLNESAREGTTD